MVNIYLGGSQRISFYRPRVEVVLEKGKPSMQVARSDSSMELVLCSVRE